MLGAVLPAWAAIPALPVGLLMATLLGDPGRRFPASLPRSPAPDFGRLSLRMRAVPASLGSVVAAAALAGLSVVVVAVLGSRLAPAIGAVRDAALTTLLDWGVLSVTAVVGLVMVRSIDALRLLGAAIVVGAVALGTAELLPGNSLLIQSINFEVPKSAGYWLPWFAAIAAALGLAAIWERRPGRRSSASVWWPPSS